MTIWTCPSCDRQFGSTGQGHMCSPGLSMNDFLAASPEFVGPITHAVVDHLRAVDDASPGDLIIDPITAAADSHRAATSDEASPSWDPMVPDDIDI